LPRNATPVTQNTPYSAKTLSEEDMRSRRGFSNIRVFETHIYRSHYVLF